MSPYLEEATIGKLPRMSCEARQKVYEEVDVPFAWQIAVLSIHLRECLEAKFAKGDDDLKEVALLLMPAAGRRSLVFDLFKPSFASLKHEGSAADLASALSRLVTDTLLPLLNEGEKRVMQVRSWTSVLQEMFTNSKFCCPIMSAAQTEILELVTAAHIVSSPEQPTTLEPLNLLLSSKVGNKALIKLAVMQNNYYKSEVASVKSTWSATLSLKPELEAAQRTLSDKPDLASVTKVVDSLLAWRNALREGATDSLEHLLLAYLESEGKKAEEHEDQGKLASVVELSSRCQKLPSYPRSSLKRKYSELCDTLSKSHESLSAKERRLRLLKNFEQIGEAMKGNYTVENIQSVFDLCHYTHSNIQEIWIHKDGRDIDAEVRDSASAALPLIAHMAVCIHDLFVDSREAEVKKEDGAQNSSMQALIQCCQAVEMLKLPGSQEYGHILSGHRRLLEACCQVLKGEIKSEAQTFLKHATLLGSLLTECKKAPAGSTYEAFHDKLAATRDFGLQVHKSVELQVVDLLQDNAKKAAEKVQNALVILKDWKSGLEDSPSISWTKVLEASMSYMEKKEAGTLVTAFQALKKETCASQLKCQSSDDQSPRRSETLSLCDCASVCLLSLLGQLKCHRCD